MASGMVLLEWMIIVTSVLVGVLVMVGSARESSDQIETTTAWGEDSTYDTEMTTLGGEDNDRISTVNMNQENYRTKNVTVHKPDHTAISDFRDLGENVDLELLFTEHTSPDPQQSSNHEDNIVLEIQEYDDDGNSQSYFLHSTQHSEKGTRDETASNHPSMYSRVSGFFRDMLKRLGVYSYIVSYRKRQKSLFDSKTPHRFHPNSVSNPKRPFGEQQNSAALTTITTPMTTIPVGGDGLSTPRPRNSPTKSTISSLFNQFKQRIKAIYPGTVWCGDGNQAKSESDIGFFYMTDSCCRAHDLCPIAIAAGEQFNRLKNNGYFTRSHCDCDKQFYNCLKNANTLVSNQIGYTYFNLLKPQCFRHEHPKVACSKNKGKCLSYVVDETQDKLWQWFDNLTY
ncbi:uncharacterized protein LOC129762192 isoform X2 [Toxorhynchites rutilus septentrionalis]|uniref:uncharacterized protein LOC129762192 isoform X2 n=1 Tax=Toxorhynchites rutilus septentrionalis TaxID=329112 RepID=UPI002478780F|nr:uncharacterized protein LOC129762192 isoform X2 [Toxorhynchites rutilus septentrionalis]